MKSVVPWSGFEPKPPDFRPGVLTTRPSRQLKFWAYVLITIHPWMRRHGPKAHAKWLTRRVRIPVGEQHFSFFEHSAFLALLMRLDKSKWDCYNAPSWLSTLHELWAHVSSFKDDWLSVYIYIYIYIEVYYINLKQISLYLIFILVVVIQFFLCKDIFAWI